MINIFKKEEVTLKDLLARVEDLEYSNKKKHLYEMIDDMIATKFQDTIHFNSKAIEEEFKKLGNDFAFYKQDVADLFEKLERRILTEYGGLNKD